MKNKQSGEAGGSIVLPRKPRLSEANENNVFFLLSVAVSILLISLTTFLGPLGFAAFPKERNRRPRRFP